MTTERDFDRIARAWLDLMPDEAPDRTVQAVLQAVEATPQLRPLRPAVGRNRPMNRFALVAAVAALVAAVAGGTMLLAGGEGTPIPSPAPPSNPAESPADEGVPESIRAVWTRQTGGFPPDSRRVSLIVAGSGDSIAFLLRGTTDLSLRSLAAAVAADEFQVVLEDDDGECVAGDAGRYRWSLDAAGGVLTLRALSEDCDDRRGSLEGAWDRSHLGQSDGGPGVVDAFDPVFSVTVPPGSYQHRKLPGTVELSDPTQDLAVWAWRDPHGFADPCSTTQRTGIGAGADAFVDYIRESGAYTNITTEELTIDGHRAVHLEFDARPDGVCPPGQEAYYLLVPSEMDTGDWSIGPGAHDSYWIVEFDYATFYLQVLPIGSPHEAAIVESLRFP